jgi:hypothetical protein
MFRLLLSVDVSCSDQKSNLCDHNICPGALKKNLSGSHFNERGCTLIQNMKASTTSLVHHTLYILLLFTNINTNSRRSKE